MKIAKRCRGHLQIFALVHLHVGLISHNRTQLQVEINSGHAVSQRKPGLKNLEDFCLYRVLDPRLVCSAQTSNHG